MEALSVGVLGLDEVRDEPALSAALGRRGEEDESVSIEEASEVGAQADAVGRVVDRAPF